MYNTCGRIANFLEWILLQPFNQMNPPSLGRMWSSSLRACFTGRQLGVLIMALALGISPVHAAFLNMDWGARATGMGGAFSAVADDSSAPLFNPAGIVQV